MFGEVYRKAETCRRENAWHRGAHVYMPDEGIDLMLKNNTKNKQPKSIAKQSS